MQVNTQIRLDASKTVVSTRQKTDHRIHGARADHADTLLALQRGLT